MAASKLTPLFENNPTSDGLDVEVFFLFLCVIGLGRGRELAKALGDLNLHGTPVWGRATGWTREARSLWAASHLLMLYVALNKLKEYKLLEEVEFDFVASFKLYREVLSLLAADPDAAAP